MSTWKTDNWEVSEYNWSTEVRQEMTPPDTVEIHDATLRDGAHVVDFSDEERTQFAVALSELGIRRIEIESRAPVIKRQSKYPPETHGETLKAIVNMGLKAGIFTMRNVIEGRAGIDEALKWDVSNIVLQEPVNRGRLQQLNQTREQRINQIFDVITYAKEHGCFVDFFFPRITESELDYSLQIVAAGIEAGADSLCITDSAGSGTPQTFRFLVRKFQELTGDQIPVEIHPHNDFGLAMANLLAGYEAGASVIHCCVNGLGARAGNTSLEEAVIALHVLYGVDLGLKYSKLYDVSKLVETMQQWPMAKNKPFYGYGISQAPYKLLYFGKNPRKQ
jgi:isopropylmalate/homocitrate/citramalate synthase